MLVLLCISLKLVQVLGWILKVEPWSLWSHVQSAHWVGSPAISHSVIEVVWVGVGVVLVAIQSEVVSIQVVLWLKSLWKRSCLLISQEALEEEIRKCDSKECKNWKGGILLGDHPVHH